MPEVNETKEVKHMEDIISAEFDKLAEDPAPEEKETTSGEEVEVQEETSEEITEEHEAEEVKAQADEEEVEEEPEYDEPAPARWSEEMKATYEELPPAARKLMVENIYKPMQRQYTETTTDLSKMKDKVAPLLQIMDDYGSDFERAGANPVDAIRRQAAWAQHFLKVGVEQGVEDMRKQFGIKGADGQAETEYLTPTERKLKAEVEDMKSILQRNEQESVQQTEQQQQEQYRAHIQQVHGELKSFIDEQKDGKPAHPYVEKVAPQIAGIIRGGLVTRVDDYGQPVPIKAQIAQAYRMACDMNPSIRSAKLTGKDARQVEKVKAAQDVNVVTTMPSGKPSGVPTMTVEQAVNAAYDKLAGG